MAIESVRAIQHGDSKFISDFSVTFKKIRITNTSSFSAVLEKAIDNLSVGRAADMMKDTQNNGQTSGRTIDDMGNEIGVSSMQGAFNRWQDNQLNM
jgi:hypothetical protein